MCTLEEGSHKEIFIDADLPIFIDIGEFLERLALEFLWLFFFFICLFVFLICLENHKPKHHQKRIIRKLNRIFTVISQKTMKFHLFFLCGKREGTNRVKEILVIHKDAIAFKLRSKHFKDLLRWTIASNL